MNKTETAILHRAFNLLESSNDGESAKELIWAIAESAAHEAVFKLAKSFKWDAKFWPEFEVQIRPPFAHIKYSAIQILNTGGSSRGVSDDEAESISFEAEKIAAEFLLACGIKIYLTRDR